MQYYEEPIKVKKVRNGIFAYQYINGTINIEGQKYFFYSMTDAIKAYRMQHPARKSK